MKHRRLETFLTAIAITSMILPVSAIAVSPTTNNTQFDPTYANTHAVYTTETNESITKRWFGGDYKLLSAQAEIESRPWEVETVPASARSNELIMTCKQSHGNKRHGVVQWAKAHPYLVAGGVVTAVAVTLVSVNDEADR